MFQNRLYCVMITAPIRDDKINDELFIAAHLMIRSQRSKQKVRGDGFEGQVTTKRNVVTLGGISGIEFFADLEADQGSLKVHYIVRHVDLNDIGDAEIGAWADANNGALGELRPSPLSRLKKIVQSN